MEGKHWPFALMVVGGVGGLMVSAWLLVIGWFGSWMTEDDYSAAVIWGVILGVASVVLLGTGISGGKDADELPATGPEPASVSQLAPCPSCLTRYNAATLPACPRCGKAIGDR